MKAKITEIFRSFQGEGKYVSAEQVFVRFFGCNANCLWCDTRYSRDEEKGSYKALRLDEVLREVIPLSYGCHSVSVTGGEPLCQADFLKQLLSALKEEKINTYLETNGVLYKELSKVIDWVDIVSMDIKLHSSTGSGDYFKEHKQFLSIAKAKDCFVKMVITNETSDEEAINAAKLIREEDKEILLVLQPEFSQMNYGSLAKCYEIEGICRKSLNNIRIIPQMHKLTEVR
ncbi:MAG: 7-carboxy-7-deazaguanine synthase QueE [Candidatus Omnitrophica bacterium]|nr:7-carboxy-7-deazaguanine synthase QueE [Candidatus Omnitrophota bacterium]